MLNSNEKEFKKHEIKRLKKQKIKTQIEMKKNPVQDLDSITKKEVNKVLARNFESKSANK